VVLSNLGAHPDAVDMGTTRRRRIRSSARDTLIARSAHNTIDVDCTAGGTIVLTTTQQYANGTIRLTGTPGAGFTIELADGTLQLSFINTTGQTATIETATGATTPPTILAGATKTVFERTTDLEAIASIGSEVGAFLHDGSIPATGDQDWADNELKRVRFTDTAQTVQTPSSTAGVLVLDMELGNVCDVALDEDVTTLTLDNPPADGIMGVITLIATQDVTGTWDITWPAAIKWEQDSGLSPAQTTTGDAVDIYALITIDAGTTWYGFVMGLDFS